jgi:hypothetical protein
MIISLLKRYKWHLLIVVALYAAISFWLFFLTDSPQSVPFEYQIN